MIGANKIQPIHPFAARMAPEIAFEALNGIPKGSLILDPMSGSGTVLRTVSEYGYRGLGLDVDPLSILMSKVWTSAINPDVLRRLSEIVIKRAQLLRLHDFNLAWIDRDSETREFIEFWFARPQIRSLRKLSYILHYMSGPYSDALRICLSKLIITKNRGASLAADVSHSRPHRVRKENDFDVIFEFQKSCQTLAKLLETQKPVGNVEVRLGDARMLNGVKSNTIDGIITSPPYLNALDYMRGHKLALVWLGYQIGELGLIRSGSVGAERAPNPRADMTLVTKITAGMKNLEQLPMRTQNMIFRYALDIHAIMKEAARVLKDKGRATFVVGNSTLQGIYVENTMIVNNGASLFGLELVNEIMREIPETRRYLPPPTSEKVSTFKSRMRTESILTYLKN